MWIRHVVWVALLMMLGASVSAQNLPPQDGVLPTLSPRPFEIDNYFSDDVEDHIQFLYQRGQQFGNRDATFSKVGDSLTVSRNFLYPFGDGRYNLASYDYLQVVIDHYSQSTAHLGNSFVNVSLAAREGWTAQQLLDPEMSDRRYCEEHESPLLCEYRIVRPSIALILLGTNDTSYQDPRDTIAHIETIVHYTEELGIIPVLSTIPYRHDRVARVNLLNQALRILTEDQQLPLIDLYALTDPLPNHGLTTDNIHLSSSPAGLTQTATFLPRNLQYGYTVRNLATLNTLYHIRAVLADLD